jgi:capsular exopolysaccharide synthesis family protein
MHGSLGYYAMLAKRWAWMVVLGIVICGSGTYIVSKLIPPVYQASATLIINLKTSTSTSDNVNASELAVPTYAQLLTDPAVLEPVVAQHQGLTLEQLSAMISVKPQSNTQLIELDVKNSDPQLAMQLANEICQRFVQFSASSFSADVQIVPAILPTDPIGPRPLQRAGLGALVGLGLALTLIVVFEWIDDLPSSSEEVEKLLDTEVLTVIPQISRKQRRGSKKPKEIPALAEGYRLLYTSLNAAQVVSPFKLLMVTSALAGEGKSAVATNLASLLATADKSVLLVDANLRCPLLHQHFQLDNHHGLANVLLEMEALPDGEMYGQATSIPTLRVLTAGVPSSNDTELLQSPRGKRFFDHLKQASFDYIIFDTPPLLHTADAQTLALHIQTIVLVVDASRTSRKMLLRAKRVLRRTHATLMGVTINKSRWSDYGDIRKYLSPRRQPETASTTTMPPPTPTTDGLVNPPDNLMDLDASLIEGHEAGGERL